jgi:hypothetical protein
MKFGLWKIPEMVTGFALEPQMRTLKISGTEELMIANFVS